MYFAMGVDPTNETARMIGSSRIASTASLSPCTTLKIPSGRPASRNASASQTAAEGSRSEGFRITALPAAIAVVTIHSGTIAGKLNGVMHATTPSGCRTWCTSTPPATCSEYSPLRWCMRPVQNSTFSRPRATSPIASDTVLPCSDVMTRPSSSARKEMISRSRNITALRLARPVSRHAGCAALAFSATSWRNSALAKATSAVCRPVAGLKTGPTRTSSPVWVTRSPATKCGMVGRVPDASASDFSIVGVVIIQVLLGGVSVSGARRDAVERGVVAAERAVGRREAGDEGAVLAAEAFFGELYQLRERELRGREVHARRLAGLYGEGAVLACEIDGERRVEVLVRRRRRDDAGDGVPDPLRPRAARRGVDDLPERLVVQAQLLGELRTFGDREEADEQHHVVHELGRDAARGAAARDDRPRHGRDEIGRALEVFGA